MREKSYEEIVDEYQRRKLEAGAKFRHGHWEKCPMCGGTQVITCESCQGTGHTQAPAGSTNSGKFLRGQSDVCPVCHGAGKMKCRHPQCRSGSVWVTE